MRQERRGLKKRAEAKRRASCHRQDDSKVISSETTSADVRAFYRDANEAVDFTALGFALQHRDEIGRQESREKRKREGAKEKDHPPPK